MRETRVIIPDLPLLGYFVQKKKKEIGNILDKKCVVLCLHFLRDLLPFVDGLRELGMEPENCWLLAKPYPYPYKEIVKEELEKEGFKNIKIASQYPIGHLCNEILHEAYRHCIASNLEMIIVEDGGHFCEQIPSLPSHDKIIGAVEQTTKGIRKYNYLKEKGGLDFPVLSVASSQFKHEYEPRFIGATVIRNIRKFLPDMHLAGKKALVFGYSSIGKMVAHYLKIFEGMIVDICEKDPRRFLLALMDNFNAKKDVREFADKNWILVVGCTGGYEEKGETLPTIDKDIISQLQHGCILVSASSDQVEIDLNSLREFSQGNTTNMYIDEIVSSESLKSEDVKLYQGKIWRLKIGTEFNLTLLRPSRNLRLLADGYPINFYSVESVPNETIDPILTLLYLCVIHLVQDNNESPKDILEDEVDKIVEKEELIETFMRIHGVY